MQSVQLLGEIDTYLVRLTQNGRKLCPQEQVYLEVEPVNRTPMRTIRVEDGQLEPIGCLTRRAAAWLAPLIDSEVIRVDGYIPNRQHLGGPVPNGSDPLRLIVFAAGRGAGILGRREPRTKEDALHEVVRFAYERVQTFASPELVLEFAGSLEGLADESLLPETHLLLALIPGVARELRAAQLMLGRYPQPPVSPCNGTL